MTPSSRLRVALLTVPHAATRAQTVNAQVNLPKSFSELRRMPRRKLIAMGMQPFDESGLLLFPYAWYDSIPEGFKIVTISGRVRSFQRGKTDKDQRCGALAYGIVRRGAE